MPLVPLPNNSVINIQFFGMLNNQRIITLFQFKFDGNTAPATDYTDYMSELFEALDQPGQLRTDLEGCLPNNYVTEFVRLQPVYPTRLRAVDFTWTSTGLYSQAAGTSNLASSIERYSKLNRRRGVGRVQVPTPSGVFANGILSTAGYITALTALSVAMRSDLTTSDPGTIGTWLPVIHNTSAAQPLTSYVDGTSVKTTVRTMHRRTVGLGI